MRERRELRADVRRAVFGGLLLVGLVGVPVLAPTLAQPATAAASAADAAAPAVRSEDSDLDDFTFNSFDGDYTLGRDAEGHSTLTTVETFDAQFPDFDQNRGFVRQIPEKYDGHPTDVTIVSVTDGNGQPRPYSTDSEDDFLMVTMAGDDFVRGQQTYVLTFTQRYVTDYFEDANDDEFYWDTIGTAAEQPVDRATATVHVPADLTSSLQGSPACYYGPEGSRTPCDVTSMVDADGGTTITTEPRQLAAGENVSVVVPFAPGTFVPRDSSFFASGAAIASLVFAAIALLFAIGAVIVRVVRLRNAPGRGTIIAEYTPPPGVNLLLASVIAKQTARGPAAAFVSLAVRRNIQIVEKQPEGKGKPTYWLRFVTAQGLDPAELALAKVLFGDPLVSGAWKELSKHDTTLGTGVSKLTTEAQKSAETEGYIKGGSTLFLTWFCLLGAIAATVGAFIAGIVALDSDYGGAGPVFVLLLSVLAVVVVFVVGFRKPFTAKGAELRDYLKGLELYIRLAEKDRFEMLQSPEGAQKTQVSAPDQGQVVRIYEKLLPFAVLLDLEKEWSEVLGTYYESLGSQPDWYAGNTGAFNTALFASSIGSLSSSVSSSLASSASSSSSGGSGGGGFSGGGGGGGGTSGV